MSGIFLKLLNMSITAGWLILAGNRHPAHIPKNSQMGELPAVGHRGSPADLSVFHR